MRCGGSSSYIFPDIGGAIDFNYKAHKKFVREQSASCPRVLLMEAPFTILLESIHPRLTKSGWCYVKQGTHNSSEKKKKNYLILARRNYSTGDQKQKWVPWPVVVCLVGLLHSVEDSSALNLLVEGERQIPHLHYWQFVKGRISIGWYLLWDARPWHSFNGEDYQYP